MKPEVSDIIEVTMPIPERVEGDGVFPGGIHGGIEPKDMIDRAKRVKGALKRVDFRECIPCDRCGNCLEMRKFSKKGKDEIVALYCLAAEMEVTPFHTCNTARRARNNRKKVVYYLEGAPGDFKATAENVKADVLYQSAGMKTHLEPTIPTEGYEGGSLYYSRADGEKEKEGSGEMPRRLMN